MTEPHPTAPVPEIPAPKVPPHTPVQCVTVDGLRRSHLSLSRLTDSTAKRIRDEMAREYGVAAGDVIERDGQPGHVEVESISLEIARVPPDAEEPGDARLIVRGGEIGGNPDLEYSIHWNPTTCRVVRKGGGA